MTLKELLHEIAGTLRRTDGLSSYAIVEEDKGDPSAELALAVGKSSMAILVGWVEFTPVQQGNANGAIYGDAAVAVTVFERPIVNRPNGGMRIHEIAIAVAKTLAGAKTDDMVCPLFLKKIHPPVIADKLNTVGVDVEFSTKVEI